MKRDIKQIRKEITRRKQRRLPATYYQQSSRSNDGARLFVEEEEKHGYLPSTGKFTSLSESNRTIPMFLLKSMVAAIIFLLIVLTQHFNQPWLAEPESWATSALTEEFPFATVNEWYQNQFGSPLALVSNTNSNNIESSFALPVNGTISESFQTNGNGILISTEEDAKVYAMDSGTIIFAGNDRQTNKTIIVQHPDKSQSIYGNLSDIKVNQYQFIQENQVIGSFEPTEQNANQLYFAIRKNNQYLDPVQVIQVDETS